MIEIRCECGALLRGKEEHTGKVVRCPKCGTRVAFPRDEGSATEAIVEEGPRPSRRGRQGGAGRYDDHDDREYDESSRPRRRRYETDEDRLAAPISGKALMAMLVGLFALMVVGLLAIPGLSLALGVFTFIIPALVALPALLLGILGLMDINRERGDVGGGGLAIAGLSTAGVSLLGIGLLVFLQSKYKENRGREDTARMADGEPANPFAPGGQGDAVERVRRAAERTQSLNNLKQIALAMHNYNDAMGKLPPAVIYSPDGRPFYSWRVLLLPYLEQHAVYSAFRLDEPWDSPHNLKLVDQMPAIFAHPGKGSRRDSHYRVFHSIGVKRPAAPFRCDPAGMKPGNLAPLMVAAPGNPKVARSIADNYPLVQRFVDGTSNTFLVVEAAEGVPWTKPGDLAYEPDLPLPRLGGHFPGGFCAVFADASARFIDTVRHGEATLRLAIQSDDGVPLPPHF